MHEIIKSLSDQNRFLLPLSRAGPDSFYVTNDNYFHYDSTYLKFFAGFFLHNWLHANIVFYDGFKAIEAIAGVDPNGIAMDKDGRLEYVIYTSNHLLESVPN